MHLICFCIRKLVVQIWATGLPATGRVVQGGSGVSAADAQGGNSLRWTKNFQLFPGNSPAPLGDPAWGEISHRFALHWLHNLISTQQRAMSTVVLPWPQVNEQAGHVIQYDTFYIHELDELIDIRNDYVTWIQKQMYQSVSQRMVSLQPLLFYNFVHVWPWVHSSVLSGSRRRSDSVQVSVCVWCPGKNHLASDWCCHANAGMISLLSSAWQLKKRGAKQLTPVLWFILIVFHFIVIGRWQ